MDVSQMHPCAMAAPRKSSIPGDNQSTYRVNQTMENDDMRSTWYANVSITGLDEALAAFNKFKEGK